MTNCKNCNQPIFFNDNRKSASGRVIPLNEDQTAHDCQGKYKNGNGNKPKEEVSIPVSQELDALHKEAIGACRKYLGSEFDNMTEDKKFIAIFHYENILAGLKQK